MSDDPILNLRFKDDDAYFEKNLSQYDYDDDDDDDDCV